MSFRGVNRFAWISPSTRGNDSGQNWERQWVKMRTMQSIYCTVDTAAIRKSNIDTPMIAVLSADNTILCSFNLYEIIDKETIDTIIKTIKTITKPTNDKK